MIGNLRRLTALVVGEQVSPAALRYHSQWDSNQERQPMNQPLSSFADQLDDLPELRPFPAVATRLMEAMNDPATTAATLGEILKCDPSISLKLLSLANGSVFGFSGEVRTVEHAIVVLGQKKVRNLAISAAAEQAFASGETAAEERQVLWQHSLGCGVLARAVAKHLGDVADDEAFLAGVVHDVGKLVFLDHVPDDYQRVAMAASVSSIVNAEREAFGLDHTELGLRCGEDWGLPWEINEVIGNHHATSEASEMDMLTRIVAAANSLAQAWEIGPAGTVTETPEEVVQRLELPVTAEDLELLRKQATMAFGELQQHCGP